MRWLIFCVFVGSLALGQSNDRRRFSSDVFQKGRFVKDRAAESLWRKGSFHVTPIFGLRQLGFDNNVFSSEENKVEDFSIAPELGLLTYYRFSNRWIWENRVTYDYLYYKDLDQLNGSEFGGTSRLYGLFKRVYFDSGVDFRRDRQRVSSEIDDRVLSNKLTYDLNFSVQVMPRGHLSLKPSVYSIEYDEETGDTALFTNLERDELRIELRYLHKAHPSFWPFVEVSLESFDFDAPGNFRDNSEMTAIYAGARNEYGKRLHYNVRLGLAQMRFEPVPNLLDVDSDIFSTRSFVSYKITRRYDVEGSAEQFPVFSISDLYGYFISRRVSFGFGYRIRNKIRVGPELVVGENDYDRSIVPVEQLRPLPELRNDKIRMFNLRVTIPFARILEWQVSLGYLERDSNQPGFSDEGIQVFSNIAYKTH